MSYFNEMRIKYADSGSIDPFNRLRTSLPFTLFDSKQLYDKSPLFFDEVLSGVGTTSTHSTTNAATTIAVTNNNEYVIRQSKMRMNYSPAKGQFIVLTGVMSNEANVTKRIGYFSSSAVAPYTPLNGFYFESDGTTWSVNIVKNGTPDSIPKASWNIDPMDGNGPSGLTIDDTKAQIFAIDFEWLGVGRVRFGVAINGLFYYVHEYLHANNVTSVYTSTPNQPVRYEIRSTGGAGSMVHICSSIQSEGGFEPTGTIRSV